MITVNSAVRTIISSSPLLEDGMSRDLLNVSAVARTILPRVNVITKKDVSEGAVVMALKRLRSSLPPHLTTNTMTFSSPDLLIRSNLIELTYRNGQVLAKQQKALHSLVPTYGSEYFLTATAGVFETTIIASNDLEGEIKRILEGSQLIDITRQLSSLTMRLTPAMITDTGSIAHILRRLAWEGINVVEVVSTRQELTVIVKADDANRAFTALHKPQ